MEMEWSWVSDIYTLNRPSSSSVPEGGGELLLLASDVIDTLSSLLSLSVRYM